MSALGDAWVAYHLYYHEQLDRVVHGFILPLVADLFEAGRIDRFFFVRYKLGGPHVRLRLRVVSGHEEEVDLAVRHQARRFLALQPSKRSLEPELILKTTRSLIAQEPGERDDTIYPDNTLRRSPFHPETERYGGPALIGASLDFFTVSSAGALLFLSRQREESRTLQLGAALRLLLRQALGFAANENEIIALLGYGEESGGASSPAVVAKGDRVFETRPETFHALFRGEILALKDPDRSEPPELSLLGAAALALSQALEKEASLRLRIGSSQLHMTANRLGLLNPEEIYLSRLLTRASREISRADPDLWKDLQELLGERVRPPRDFSLFEPVLLRRTLRQALAYCGGRRA